MTGAARDYAVVRVLNDLEALRRLLRLYPTGHPSLQPARERLRERVLGLGADGDVMTASFAPGRLLWDGQEIVVPEIMPAARLAPLLFHLGLSAVRLTLPEAADGAVALATRLAALNDPPGEADRVALVASPRAFPGLELVPIDLSGVQLVGSGDRAAWAGPGGVASELVSRLSRAGAFPLDGLVRDGELEPGSLVGALSATGDPKTLFDHLFRQLAEIVRDAPEKRRPVALAQVRAYFAETIRLLDPKRRSLAVATAFRHLPLATRDGLWVAAETLLDAVELMLSEGLAIPDQVRKVLHALANPVDTDRLQTMPNGLVIRARHLLAAAPARTGAPSRREDAAPPSSPAPEVAAWASELSESLTDEHVKLHVVRLLQEAITLWPNEEVAERATVRLAEEFVAALEVEDVETAARLAPLLAAARSDEAVRLCNESGVAAAVTALRRVDKTHHAELTAILVAFGERGLPAVLAALAEEQSITLRRRLLEAVTRLGPRATPYLRQPLDDRRWFVARNAAFLLRRIGDPEALSLLRSRLGRAHPKVVVEILKALVALGDPEWLAALEATLDSEDVERAGAALAVAARIRLPEVTQLVMARVRARAGKRMQEPFTLDLIRALGALRDPAALPALQEIVAVKRWRNAFSPDAARLEAAAAIARLEGPAARAAARALAEGKDRGVAEAVRAALDARAETREEDR